MSKIKIRTRTRKILADTITPVSIYLKLRDRFANSFLLESSDYHGAENSFSYICCSPLAYFKAGSDTIERKLPDGTLEIYSTQNLKEEIKSFTQTFEPDEPSDGFIKSGLFGYFNYDAKAQFGDLKIDEVDDSIPIAQYHLFQFIIAMDHFRNECHIIEAYLDEPHDDLFEEVSVLIQQRNIPGYPFKTLGEKQSNKTDKEYLKMVEKGIHHCHIGDVFQVVLSRNFKIPYQGDDFQVYRTLRSVNPSPYLFYFDYGSFRIFGSSPEAQIVLKDRKAEIHPIAGTFRRTGDDKADSDLAEKLLKDPKE
ncbi:MAG: chorismate-binding protein, partial [Bacteroidota bacterium]